MQTDGRDRTSWMVRVQNLIMELVDKGELSPVFFGSALTNFGVETFLETFPEDDNFTASKNSLDEGRH